MKSTVLNPASILVTTALACPTSHSLYELALEAPGAAPATDYYETSPFQSLDDLHTEGIEELDYLTARPVTEITAGAMTGVSLSHSVGFGSL